MKARPYINNGFKMWCVQYTEFGKTKKFQNKSKSVVEDFIKEYKRKKQDLSKTGIQLMGNPKVSHMVYEALRRTEGKSYNLIDAIEFYENHHDINEKSLGMEEGVLTFIEDKKRQAKSVRTIGEYSQRLNNLTKFIGAEKPISSVTTKKAEEWLNKMKVKPITRNHFRRVGNVFFNWAKKKGYTEINPFMNIEKAHVVEQDVEAFTHDQIKQLIDGTDHVEAKLWIAIGAYAGIRPEEMNKLYWEKIHLNTKKIDLTALASKKSRRRIIEIQPNLYDILMKYKGEGKVFTPKVFETSPYLKRLREKMDFEWIQDGLRHSFGSYHLAAFQDSGKTSLQMGHGGSPRMLFEHYNQPGISQEEGRAYFGIKQEKKEQAS
jgi:integrase